MASKPKRPANVPPLDKRPKPAPRDQRDLLSEVIAVFRPKIEPLLAAGEVIPGGAVEAEIKAMALKYRAELARYWRLMVDEHQSDTAIANKIARKFGLILNRARRVTVAGQQQWVYGITASDTWRALVSAREYALTGGSTNLLEPPYNRFVLPLDSSPPPEGRAATRGDPPYLPALSSLVNSAP